MINLNFKVISNKNNWQVLKMAVFDHELTRFLLIYAFFKQIKIRFCHKQRGKKRSNQSIYNL